MTQQKQIAKADVTKFYDELYSSIAGREDVSTDFNFEQKGGGEKMKEKEPMAIASILADMPHDENPRRKLYYLEDDSVCLETSPGWFERIDGIECHSLQEAVEHVFNCYANQPAWDLQWEPGIQE